MKIRTKYLLKIGYLRIISFLNRVYLREIKINKSKISYWEKNEKR